MKRIIATVLPLIVFISLIFNFILFHKQKSDEQVLSPKKTDDENKRIKLVAEDFIEENKKYFDINFYKDLHFNSKDNKSFLEFNPVVKQTIKLAFLCELEKRFTNKFEKETLPEDIKHELREFYYKINKEIDKEKRILYDVYPDKISVIDKMYLDQLQ